MIELTIALVAILAVFAALVQVAFLAKAQNDTYNLARRRAGQMAMTPLTVIFSPDYIELWEPGDDDSPYTRDDDFTYADASLLQLDIVEKTIGDPADWPVLDSITGNALTDLRQSADPAREFGLVKGEAFDSVPLLPAVKHLLFRKGSIDLDTEVWLTSTTDIY